MDEHVKFKLIMKREDFEVEQKADISDDLTFGEVEPVEPTEPLTEARFLQLVAVMVVAGISALAHRLANRWLRSKDRGTLVDLSKDPFEISLVRNIPYGTVILVSKDGASSVHRTDAQNPDELQSFFLELLKKTL